MFRKIMITLISVIFLFYVQLLISPSNVNSAIVEYNLNQEFSGGTSPTGDSPWLKWILNDGGTPGSVRVEMIAENLVLDEFVSQWYMNVDPDYNDLMFLTYEPSTVYPTNIQAGTDSFKADGVGGLFDILFSFNTSNHNRFGEDDYFVMNIFGSGITANTFNYTSFQKDGSDGLYTAAHIQGIGNDSGWVTCGANPVPVPSTMLLLLSGMVGLISIKRRGLNQDEI